MDIILLPTPYMFQHKMLPSGKCLDVSLKVACDKKHSKSVIK